MNHPFVPHHDDDTLVDLLAEADDSLAGGTNAQSSGDGEPGPDVNAHVQRNLPVLRLLHQLRPPRLDNARRLGRFIIRRELGRGGFGVVFLADDPHLGRPIALKVPRTDFLADEKLRERFHLEARAAARLDHQNIVAVYEAGDIGPVSYIATAYCPGTNLAAWLRGRRDPLPWREAAELVATLANAIHYAHGQGVLHRDLKPANVLLQIDETKAVFQRSEIHVQKCEINNLKSAIPKIADFGLARIMDSDQTQSHNLLGTPHYMAPEQASQGPVGPATDIWALGAILYESLTGRPPFRAATAVETLTQLTNDEPLPPRSLNSIVPPELEAICLKCLEKEPGRRYTTAAAFADDLVRLLEGRPVLAKPVGPVGRGWRYAKRRPTVAALAALLAVLFPVALAVTTALYLRAEARGHENLARRIESFERLSQLARTRSWVQFASREFGPAPSEELLSTADSIDQHMACAEECSRLIQLGIDPPRLRLVRAEHLNLVAAFRLDGQIGAPEAIEEAIAAFEVCLREQPDSTDAQIGLLEARLHRLTAIRQNRMGSEELRPYDELLVQASAMETTGQTNKGRYRLLLTNIHRGRAAALFRLGRSQEAADAYGDALRMDNGWLWPELNILRACALARSGRSAEALAAVNLQAANPHHSGWNLFNIACCFALIAEASELSPETREQAALDAIAALGRLLRHDRSKWQKLIDGEVEFDSIRRRVDFQKLINSE